MVKRGKLLFCYLTALPHSVHQMKLCANIVDQLKRVFDSMSIVC